MAILKNPNDIEKMRVACRLAADVLEMIEPHVVEGTSTGELNRICHEYITQIQNAVPSPLNYHGYPASICTSVNEVVCHGIPDFSQLLKSGDIVNLDITVYKNGFHGDTSKTFIVGEVTPKIKQLVSVTQECLYKAIKIVRPGIRLGDIGYTIQKHAESNGFSVVKDYTGHGIGRNFHEDPSILHYGKKGTGIMLKEGMTFTIEPMINMGKFQVVTSDSDGWTVTTKDKLPSAQFEHTVIITRNGCEVLTKRNDEIII